MNTTFCNSNIFKSSSEDGIKHEDGEGRSNVVLLEPKVVSIPQPAPEPPQEPEAEEKRPEEKKSNSVISLAEWKAAHSPWGADAVEAEALELEPEQADEPGWEEGNTTEQESDVSPYQPRPRSQKHDLYLEWLIPIGVILLLGTIGVLCVRMFG